MPNIVIYVDSKAKYSYNGGAEDFKVMDWLNKSLTKVNYPLCLLLNHIIGRHSYPKRVFEEIY